MGFILSRQKINNKNVPKFEELSTPQKSVRDTREYKVIKLQNGLRACLIADNGKINESNNVTTNQGQKKAAAAVCVGVGSFNNPPEVPGLAHFLEHMVFMGSEKYPDENNFTEFVQNHGGDYNAITETESTKFYFDCFSQHFYTALDRFAQFFIFPLLRKDSMTREREAVDSEFQMRISDDGCKRDHLFRSLSKPESPVNKFIWGNLQTLKKNIDEDVLYKKLHDFHSRHYSAHTMTLAIQAPLPMETLQDYVLDLFSNVSNNNLPPEDFSEYKTNVFDTSAYNRMYHLKTTNDACVVYLSWALPSRIDKYKSKPDLFLAHLIGDEGPGSLLSYLQKKKVWALSTEVGVDPCSLDSNSIYSIFTVAIVLTDEGYKYLNNTIEAVYSYIHLLKKNDSEERLFNEIKSLRFTSFHYRTAQESINTVEKICQNLFHYSVEDCIAGPSLFYEYNPNDIDTVLNQLVPNNMNIMVCTKKFPDDSPEVRFEDWFQTEFIDQEIPPEWMRTWANVEPYLELHVPLENVYITTDFTILPEIENYSDYPEKISHSPLYELWYGRTQKFQLPIGYYYFYLITPLAVESPSSICMLLLLQSLIEIELNEELYSAKIANLLYSCYVDEQGIVFQILGYNQNLPKVIEAISKKLVNIKDTVTEDTFNAMYEITKKYFYNKLLHPSTLETEFRLKILVDKYWTSQEKYLACLTINFATTKNFINNFLQNLYIRSLVQGNVSEEKAIETVTKFINTLNFREMPSNLFPQLRTFQLPLGEHCIRIQNFNGKDSNSIVTNYYQCGTFSMKNSVLLQILMSIFEEPLFDILRTKEQIGYQIFCDDRNTFNIIGYIISINTQATKYSTKEIDERIEKFIEYAGHLLDEMTEETFCNRKESLIKSKQCIDLHPSDIVVRNWGEIVGKDFCFDRREREIKVINEITLEDAKMWWKSYNKFSGSNEHFRKLSIQVVGSEVSDREVDENAAETVPNIIIMGSKVDEEKEQKPSNYFIHNIQEFKQNLYLYPVIKQL